jgi:hypothetical protein
MWRLILGLVLGAGLVATATLVPIRGRTVMDRWHAARSASEFFERGYREVKVAAGLEPEMAPPGRARAERQKPPARSTRPAVPTEGHTEADRAAIDRIIAENGR